MVRQAGAHVITAGKLRGEAGSRKPEANSHVSWGIGSIQAWRYVNGSEGSEYDKRT